MWKVNTKERVNIVDEICAKEGDKTTGSFPGKFIDIANEFKVSMSTVSKIWRQCCESNVLDRSMEEETNEVYPMAIFSLLKY